MKPRVIEYKDVKPQIWDDFVFSNKGGYAYYLYDVIALDRWINDKNISFCIWDDDENEIVLIAQLHIEKRITENDSFYRLHSRWGYVIKDGLTRKVENKVCEEYRKHIDKYIENYQIRTFESSMPPLTQNAWPGNPCINPLMKIGFSPSVRYTWIVRLDGDEESLLAKCEQTTRQAIRKYKSQGNYKIVESDGSKEDFLMYKYLHEETYTRTGNENAIIYDEYHQNIFFNLIPKKRCRVFFLKNCESGSFMAAVVILLYKNTAYYWWGASRNDKEVGINKYLLWEAMMIVKREYKNHSDMKWECDAEHFIFETGGAYPYKRRGKYKGLSDFKKCFGCELHPIYTGHYDY